MTALGGVDRIPITFNIAAAGWLPQTAITSVTVAMLISAFVVKMVGIADRPRSMLSMAHRR